MAEGLGRLDEEEKWLLDLGLEYYAVPGILPGEPQSSFRKALALATKLHDTEIAHRCLHNLTLIALKNNDVAAAENFWKEEQATRTNSPDTINPSFHNAQLPIAHANFPKTT